MSASHDLFILGDHEAGKLLVAETLREQGFSVTGTSWGGLLAKRGNTDATFFLGAAASNFRITLTVEFVVDVKGRLIARLSRSMVGPALLGGLLGAAKADGIFQETSDAIASTLDSAYRRPAPPRQD